MVEQQSTRRRRPGRAALVALALLAPAATAQAESAAPARSGPIRSTTVKLITGDRVEVTQRAGHPPRLRLRPGPGRERIGHQVRTARGRTLLIPSDAAPLVASGTLDRALFDVTGLVDQGFDRRPISVIVGHAPGARSVVRQRSATAATVRRELPSLDAVALDVADPGRLWQSLTRTTGAAGARAAAPGVRRVWLNGRARPRLDRSVPQIGAPEVWKAGYTGQGVTVAVLDTGVKADHPDLVGRTAESRDFTGTRPDASDDAGHGTHVASTIAGTGGGYRGVAPRARLLNGKVCTVDGCPFDGIIAGMEWAATRARVVNLSLGSEATDGTDPLSQAVNALTEKTGSLFVVAAGNSGADASVGAPGAADAALTVGSVTKQDELSPFSSRGPRLRDHALKPEISAPGSAIVAARVPGTPDGDAEPVDQHHARMSGTSMATPHVAGAAALLAQAHPDWKAGQLKAALVGSAQRLPGISALAQGAGRLDVARAVHQNVTADQPALALVARWPHPKSISREVTYRNAGPRPVTLELAATMTGPNGGTVPAAVLSPATLTVPAGGRASTTMTIDPARLGVGQSAGHLTATGPEGVSVSVPFAAHVETESYDVAVRTLGPDGAPAGGQEVSFMDATDGTQRETVTGTDGVGRIRLPNHLQQPVATMRLGTVENPLLIQVVGAASRPGPGTGLTFDARRARPVRVETDRKFDGRNSVVNPLLVDAGNRTYLGVLGDLATTLVGATAPGVPLPKTFRMKTLVDLIPSGKLDQPMDWADHLVEDQPAGGWRPPTVRSTPQDTATVRVRSHSPVPGRFRSDVTAHPVDGDFGFFRPAVPIAPGSQRLERFTAGRWQVVGTVQGPDSPGVHAQVREVELTSGGSADVAFFDGVFDPRPYAGRQGDLLVLAAGLCAPLRCAGPQRLSLGGRELARTESGEFRVKVGADAEWYTVTAEGTNTESRWYPLAARASASWRFRSGRTTETRRTAVPLLVVGFGPRLALDQSAPAGRRFTVPVTVTSTDSRRPTPDVRRLTVEVSYDDGRTWATTPLVRAGSGWRAQLTHPVGPGHVSLRASAEDSGGGSVTQTLVRAYALR